MAEIDRTYVINRQGKDYVLYVGLLDAAHRAGLRRLATEIVQFPTDANGLTCIVHATAEIHTPDGDGIPLLFDGIGDATPANVSKGVGPHYIRVAETRSKARALRDALNVTAELADDGHSDEPVPLLTNDAAPRRATPAPPQEYHATTVTTGAGEEIGSLLVPAGEWPQPTPPNAQGAPGKPRPTPQQVTHSLAEARQKRAEAIAISIAQAKGDASPPDLSTPEACKLYAGLLLDGMRAHGFSVPNLPTQMANVQAWHSVIRSLEQKFTRQSASPKA